MSDDRFIRFTPKQDNANEVISADHINSLQSASETTQKAIYQAQDRDFMDKALFILEHHRSLNALWVDVFMDLDNVDLIKSTELVYSEAEQAIVFPDASEAVDGWLYSKTYSNPNGSNMKKVMVVASTKQPKDTEIIIEISNNGTDFYDIALSDSKLFEIPTDGQKLKLRARFVRTNTDVSPRLDAWCILFRDPSLDIIEMPDGSKIVIGDPDNEDEYEGLVNIMHSQLLGVGPDDHHPQMHSHDGSDGSGLVSHASLTDVGPDDHHPKDHVHGQDGVSFVNLETEVVGTLPIQNLSFQVWTGLPGETAMYFDPKLGDRLVYVKSPDDETYMFYDLVNDRLDHTITIVQGVATLEKFIYSPYTDSSGATTTVLSGTRKTQKDATDDEIVREIESMTAPGKVVGVTVTDPGLGDSLDISWTANVEHDIVGYNVQMSEGSNISWIPVNTTGLVIGNGLTKTGLTAGRTYNFRVTAVDNSGYESVASDVVSGMPT
ncbi:fibronectin type III domain-containing protein (plasmid) [Paenibacillus sp. EC2-1]|uniref:fibronectin type III domain-containing protein n=1 Tax=Paenibacillus sp. EC2-1 TaxID=3388665 RepID=UPI003BEF44BC